MKLLRRREFLSLAAGLGLVARETWSAQTWSEGLHYFKVEPPQLPTGQRSSATITEIFSYGCPGCNAFLPYMQSLENKRPAGVTVDYLPASWIPVENWPVFQRAYLTAKILGVASKAHAAMFSAIWENGELALVDAQTRRARSPLPSIEDVARFYQRVTSVPAAKFLEVAGSFSVENDMKRSDALIRAYRAEYTPTIIVNGTYRLEPRTAGGPKQAIDLALWLVQRDQAR